MQKKIKLLLLQYFIIKKIPFYFAKDLELENIFKNKQVEGNDCY